jgi:hypothetical protein
LVIKLFSYKREVFMKKIKRLSLALIMFSTFYYITTVHAQAQDTAATEHETRSSSSAAAGHMNQAAPGMNPGMLPTADDSARPIGEGGESGGPAAQDMSGNMINDGGHGANSGADAEAAKNVFDKDRDCVPPYAAELNSLCGGT